MALIYRQAALDKFKPWLEVKGYSEGELNMLRAVIYELENLPDAQPEIIHCKGCEHASDNDYCHCKYVTYWNGPNDYCSRGKKRGDTE